MTTPTWPVVERVLALTLLPGMGDRIIDRIFRDGTLHRHLERGEVRASLPRARAILADCERAGIEVRWRGGQGYPLCLEALADPPTVLFLRGDASLLDGRIVAVVGSRKASDYGLRVARRMAEGLAVEGVVVASGLALGVDGAAHQGCLQAGGRTLAVLGCGPDRAYPRRHRELQDRIVQDGLLVSEFPPGQAALAYHFPRRNRILAALAQGVVVVEAARRSGALITVDHALDLGREIFAVPGPVDAVGSAGTNRLIQDGAHLAMDARDVTEVLGWGRSAGRASLPAGGKEPTLGDPDQRTLWDALGREAGEVEALVRTTGLAPGRLLAALSALELAGLAERGRDARICRRAEWS